MIKSKKKMFEVLDSLPVAFAVVLSLVCIPIIFCVAMIQFNVPSVLSAWAFMLDMAGTTRLRWSEMLRIGTEVLNDA